jgi:hypothetical protein
LEEEEEPEAAMAGSVVKNCARAATVGEEGGAVETGGEDRGGAVQWRRCFPSLRCPLSIGLGIEVGLLLWV